MELLLGQLNLAGQIVQIVQIEEKLLVTSELTLVELQVVYH
jgi:hypothetical protein